MTLKQQIPTDTANIAMNTNEFAETVIYTTAAGEATSIPAVIQKRGTGRVDVDDGIDEAVGFEAMIASSASGGIASPSVDGDTITLGSQKYAIVGFRSKPSTHTLMCMLVGTIERTADDYRIPE